MDTPLPPPTPAAPSPAPPAMSNSNATSTSTTRLYIGSLPLTTTEYSLLQLFHPYSPIHDLSFLWHHSGTLAGKPRGYAFVTLESAMAKKAVKDLDGKSLGNRKLVVRYAKMEDLQDDGQRAPKRKTEGDQRAHLNSKTVKSSGAMISAIERKLQEMEKNRTKPPRLGSSSSSVSSRPPSSSSTSSNHKPRREGERPSVRRHPYAA
ncbi:hypothetical protein BC832DRAFT_392373 [Gaertneriomyces semiglobifer]|nr:hypothetical protein BC832DRAFT_392373 [Gaertneriomyces semiglobifer]